MAWLLISRLRASEGVCCLVGGVPSSDLGAEDWDWTGLVRWSIIRNAKLSCRASSFGTSNGILATDLMTEGGRAGALDGSPRQSSGSVMYIDSRPLFFLAFCLRF